MKDKTVHVFDCPNCGILKIESVQVKVTQCLMCDRVLTVYEESGLVKTIENGA